MSKKKIITILVAVFLCIALIGTFAPKSEVMATGKTEVKSDAITMMETVFEGNPSQEVIKLKMDRLMSLYGFELNQENYNKVGSVLVSLKKESKKGISEMELADCIIHSHKINTEFTEAAGLCSVLLDEK